MALHSKGSARRSGRLAIGTCAAATVVVLATACGTTAKPAVDTKGDGLDKGWTQGITDTEVKVGMTFGAMGAGKANSQPDPKVQTQAPQYQAIVDHINANGGAGGRKLTLVWHRTQADAASRDVEDQATCTDFTVDRPVFIFAGPAMDCFAAKGVPQISPQAEGKSVYDGNPYLASVPNLNYTRLMKALGGQLVDGKFFQPGAKIGFMVFDKADWVEAGEQGLKPVLDKAGLTIAETVKISFPAGAADIEKTLAQVDGAALKFRDKGIDHVVFLGPSPAFMVAAEKQKYRPRYAVTSNDWPISLPDNGVAKAQLANLHGIGYSPGKDVTDYKTAGDSPARTQCLKILAAKDVKVATGADEAYLLGYCDQLFLIKQALDTAAKPVTGDTALRAVHGLGTDFKPASTWSANYGADRRDGAEVVRYLQYTTDCSCFKYAGGDVKVE